MFHGQWTAGSLLHFLLAVGLLSSVRLVGVGCNGVGGSNEGYSNNMHQDDIRKEMIKAQILQRLGLDEKPRVDQARRLSKDLALEVLKRTEQHGHLESPEGDVTYVGHHSSNETETSAATATLHTDADDNTFAKTSEIISFPEKGPLLNGYTLLSFSYAGRNAYGLGMRVKKAYLWVKLDYVSQMEKYFGHVLQKQPKIVKFYVFNVHVKKSHSTKASNLTSQGVQLDLLESKNLTLDSLGWQKLDITPAVQKWYNTNNRRRLRHHGKNHKEKELFLLLDCAGCHHSIHILTFQNDDDVPFLVLETETSAYSKRSRRRALECTPRVKHCCKQRFYVSFRDLGWDDWIIAPKGYFANYCRGHCGGPYRTPDTFLNYHTHVMEEYRRSSDGKSNLEGITPCCAPTKFASMSLIYFGPDYNIIKRDLPKMIVEECGCP